MAKVRANSIKIVVGDDGKARVKANGMQVWVVLESLLGNDAKETATPAGQWKCEASKKGINRNE